MTPNSKILTICCHSSPGALKLTTHDNISTYSIFVVSTRCIVQSFTLRRIKSPSVNVITLDWQTLKITLVDVCMKGRKEARTAGTKMLKDQRARVSMKTEMSFRAIMGNG